ncbi:hypothetical protein [Actinomadura sp. 9N215]|uniref:hypothetical protein n=1 Tax=Actinomadura sp. 9N215 TaxID=3375150 RepID=UPI00378DC52F
MAGLLPDHAPYDRVVATVSLWDIPAPWWNQLASGARLVVPLRWRSLGQSVAFTYTDGRLVSDSLHLCGFVYLVGEGEGELAGPITANELVTLHWDRDQAVNPDALQGVLDQPPVTTLVWNHTRRQRVPRRVVAAPDRHRPTRLPNQGPRRGPTRSVRPGTGMVAPNAGRRRYACLPHLPPPGRRLTRARRDRPRPGRPRPDRIPLRPDPHLGARTQPAHAHAHRLARWHPRQRTGRPGLREEPQQVHPHLRRPARTYAMITEMM